MYYFVSVVFMCVWCPCTAIYVSVQYNGWASSRHYTVDPRLLPSGIPFKCHDEVLYLQPMIHINVLTFSPLDWGMLRRSTRVLIFLLILLGALLEGMTTSCIIYLNRIQTRLHHCCATPDRRTLLGAGSPYLQHRVATLPLQHGRRHQNYPTRNPFWKSTFCGFLLWSWLAAVVHLFVLHSMGL